MVPPAAIPLELRHVTCQRDPSKIRDVCLTFAAGSLTLLAGEPDSGHELLLRVLGLLEVPDRGDLFLDGKPCQGLGEEERVKLRDRRLGFVFTAPFLLPAFTPMENVAMPLFKISDAETGEAQRRGERLLDFVGLPQLIQEPCSDLPPCAQYRVSLARALVNEPAVLLIENLDGTLAGDELRAFAALTRHAAARFQVAIIATVSPAFSAEPVDRLIEIAEGAVRRDSDLLPRPDV